MVVSQTVFSSSGRSGSDDFSAAFWQLWEQYQDELYRCCIKWIGGNPTDAEDALSRAMLKAWEKVQQYAGKITNFKAWLTRLTHNLCVDIHRERSRGANRVEDIEGYASGEKQELVSFEDTPESAVETDERRIVIRRAIDNLPTRLRETFILHFYQELSHQEIVEQQGISYQNVCKRISQARAILRKELREYFIGEDGKDTDLSVPATATESEIGEMSQENAGVEARVVEIVGGEDAPEVGRDVQRSELVMDAATSDGCLWMLRRRCLKGSLHRFWRKVNVEFCILPEFDLLHSFVMVLQSLLGWCWRVWADSGGSWLSSQENNMWEERKICHKICTLNNSQICSW